MRDSLELIREMGVAIEQVFAYLAAVQENALWRKIQADIYGCEVHTLNSSEGPAFGVALLAPGGNRRIRLGARRVRRHDPGPSIQQPSTHARWRFTIRAATKSIGSSTSIFAARSRPSARWFRKVER